MGPIRYFEEQSHNYDGFNHMLVEKVPIIYNKSSRAESISIEEISFADDKYSCNNADESIEVLNANTEDLNQ